MKINKTKEPEKQTLDSGPGGRVRPWILSGAPYAKVAAPRNLARKIAATTQKMGAHTAANA